jgi:aldehyde dehydrogenase (NAD+)
LGGGAVAQLVARVLVEAGLPISALTVTDESVEAAHEALAARPDKVIFTGSSKTSHSLLAGLAETSTPAVVELSGADAIVVTPSADLQQVARAVAFGLRLNGGAVCMSPRRLFATPKTMSALRPLLHAELAKVPGVALDTGTSTRLHAMLDEAAGAGAEVHGKFAPDAQQPLLVDRAAANMAVARSDIFAPVLSLIEAESMMHVPALYALCPYALTVSIFCDRGREKKARALGTMLNAGTLLINDIIAPTADPRVPFGGRGASGYGVTRGAEGLLEMTAVKTVLIRRGGVMLHLDATRDEDVTKFAGLIRVVHGKGLALRWAALKQLLKASSS